MAIGTKWFKNAYNPIHAYMYYTLHHNDLIHFNTLKRTNQWREDLASLLGGQEDFLLEEVFTSTSTHKVNSADT